MSSGGNATVMPREPEGRQGSPTDTCSSLTIKRVHSILPTNFAFSLTLVGVGFVGFTQYTLEVIEYRAANSDLVFKFMQHRGAMMRGIKE